MGKTVSLFLVLQICLFLFGSCSAPEKKRVIASLSELSQQEKAIYEKRKRLHSLSSILDRGNPGVTIPLPIKADFTGNLILNIPGFKIGTKGTSEVAEVGGLAWNIVPQFYVFLGGSKKIINLDPPSVGGLQYGLQFSPLKEGYLVQKKSKMEAGLGAKLNVPIAGPLEVGGGLVPFAGRDKYSEQFVPNTEGLKEMKSLKIPKSKEDFDSWYIGDQLSYLKKGGVLFNMSIGVMPVSLQGNFIVEGRWKVRLKKVGPTHVKVLLRKVLLKALWPTVSASVANAGLAMFGNRDKGFSYIFDLANSQGLQGMKKMLRGDLAWVQEKGKEPQENGIQPLYEDLSRSRGKIFKASFFAPLIFTMGHKKSETYTLSDTQYLDEKRKVTNHVGIYSKETTTGALASRNVHRAVLFSANIQRLQDDEGPDKVRPTANFKYFYQRDRFSNTKWDREIGKMVRLTGFRELFKLKPPGKKLGFLRLELDTLFSDKALKTLMEKARTPYFEENLKNDVVNKVKVFWGQTKKPAEACKWRVMRKLQGSCKKALIRHGKKAADEIAEHLRRLPEILENKSNKQWVKETAKIGKAMITNQFIFQAVLSLLSPDSYQVVMQVSGDKIQKWEKRLRPPFYQ